jgi:uncharacterized CHY-type Zn-finger protein
VSVRGEAGGVLAGCQICESLTTNTQDHTHGELCNFVRRWSDNEGCKIHNQEYFQER